MKPIPRSPLQQLFDRLEPKSVRAGYELPPDTEPAEPRCAGLDCNHLRSEHDDRGCDRCPCQGFVFAPAAP